MPAKDYIPSKEGDIVPWTENFIAVANANLAVLGLVPSETSALTTKKGEYSTNLNAAIAKQAESKAATESKNISKNALVANIRVLARQIQARPDVPDNLREQLGLNVPDTNPTHVYPFPPVDLSGGVGVGGLAALKWNRNGNPQGTTFLIEWSGNFETGWQIVGTTTKSSAERPLNGPSGHNFFRVRAQKGDIASEPSNVIVL